MDGNTSDYKRDFCNQVKKRKLLAMARLRYWMIVLPGEQQGGNNHEALPL